MNRIFLYVLTATLLMSVAPAFADDTTLHHGVENGWATQPNRIYVRKSYQHQEQGHHNTNYIPNFGRPGEIKIYDQDRVILSEFVEKFYKTNCDWEHAYPYKKCAKPRFHERSYIIGYPLPNDVTYYDIPFEVRSRLRPTPIGYQYVRVDDDALLINQNTTEVIDAVTLSSGYGED